MVKPLNSEQAHWLNQLAAQTSEYIIGVDEVGYGALAGPCSVCAAVVKRGWSHPQVKDSKKVPKALKRVQIVRDILIPPNVVFHIILDTPHNVIDAIGLGRARDECAVDAMEVCLAKYPGSSVVMDGIYSPEGAPPGVICIPKADDLVPACSAASLLAKVHRDNYMYQQHDKWPFYAWDTNVGYGTEEHEAGLKSHGLSPIHRKTFRPMKTYVR